MDIAAMNDDNQWGRVVEKLCVDTENKSIKWSPIDIEIPDPDEVVGSAFTTEVAGKKLLAYEFRYRHYVDEDQWYWDRNVAVEFIDNQHQTEWRFPRTGSHWRLIEAIRFRLAGADSFAATYLADAG